MSDLLDVPLAPINLIWVDRENRQRSEMEPDPALQASIQRLGLIQPIVITRSFKLLAGERRWTACKALGWTSIPVRWFEELPEVEQRLVELEENIKRRDLPWFDIVSAISELHTLYCSRDPAWNQARTAEATATNEGYISRILLVAPLLADPRVAAATSINEASNLIRRRNERASDAEINELAEFARELAAPKPPVSKPGHVAAVLVPAVAPPPAPWSRLAVEQTILQENFLKWAPTYNGPKFNLLHCDFPYGIGVFEGAGQFKPEDQEGAYHDTPETFWALLDCLVKNIDRLMGVSGHIVFWHSSRFGIMQALNTIFSTVPGLEFYPYSLVWHKTDNSGIAGDSQRHPRHTHETALLAIRGRRPLVRTGADSYAGPGDRKLHPSAKPEPMLRHFLGMLVDEHTRLLDPTCGAGSAIRAAESLGARPSSCLGLEIEERFVKASRESLQLQRLSATASSLSSPLEE